MADKSIFPEISAPALLKLITVITLCLLSLGLYRLDGRYILVEENILPNLDFTGGAKHWFASAGNVHLNTSEPPELILSNRQNRQAMAWRNLPNPSQYRHIRVAAEIKVDGVVAGPNWWNKAGIILFSIDRNGAKMNYWPSTLALLSGDVPWRRYEAVYPVAGNVNRMQLSIFLIQAGGTMSVRDITVDALEVATWFRLAEFAMIALWIAAALWILLPILYRERRNWVAYGALSVFLATLAGVLTPQPHQSQFMEAARNAFDDTVSPALTDSAPRTGPAPGAEKPEEPKKDGAAPQKTRPAPPVSSRIIAAVPAPLKRGGGSFAAHFATHALLAFLTFAAFRHAPAVHLALYLAVAAAVTEILQVFVITRSAGLVDGSFNAAGIAAGIAGFILWSWIWRGIRRRPAA